MAHTYAGVLGFLTFITCIVRGLLHGYGPDVVLRTACAGMAMFGVIGLVIGAWAQWIVKDSVESQLAAELASGRSDGQGHTDKDVAKPVQ